MDQPPLTPAASRDLADEFQPNQFIDSRWLHQTPPPQTSDDATHASPAPQMSSTARSVDPPEVVTFADALTIAFKSILRDSSLPLSRNVCKFSGHEYEDPVLLIQKLAAYFIRHEIDDEQDKVRIAVEQLKGDAAKWYEPFLSLNTTFDQFRDRVMTKYNSPNVIAAGVARLYGERQRYAEPVEVFITRKRNLFRRFNRGLPEANQCTFVLEQLRPEIRTQMRTHPFTDLESLCQVAAQIERDLQYQHVYRNPQHQNQKGTNPSNTNVTPQNPNRNGNNHNNNRNGDNRNKNANSQNVRQNGYTPRKPPNPCRFCGGDHYNNDCPQHPYRPGNSQAEGPQTGNRQAANQTSQDPRPTTSH